MVWFQVPTEFKEQYNFLSMYKYKEGTRIIPNNPSTVKPEVKKESNGVNGAAASKANFPLKGATFVLDDSIKGKNNDCILYKQQQWLSQRMWFSITIKHSDLAKS